MSSVALGTENRDEAWRRFGAHDFDVVVIGGGVTGAGAALDATTRGLSVALIEARDWAAGTSSRSSKLFHGGLRYLEQFQFGLVREALRERELMMTRLAPHLVKPLPLIYPLSHRVWERPYVGIGLLLYDTLGGENSLPGQKHLSRQAALKLFPGLRSDALVGAVRYFDAETDDARHTLTVVRTAAQHGAVVRSSTQSVRLVREGERVVGTVVRDVENGEETTIRSGVVVNCTGVWTDQVQAMSGGSGDFHVRASKGVHIVVGREKIDGTTGLILRTATSVLFVLPWKRHWLIGTTDTDWEGGLAHPAATSTDIEYLLDVVNGVLATPISRDDIEGVYVGLRPLLAGNSEQTSKLSREHAVGSAAPGIVSVAGGKYTTYRVMAADAIDAAATHLGRDVPASCTDEVPLLGADGYPALRNRTAMLAAEHGLSTIQVEHLLERYGWMLAEVLAPSTELPALLEPVPGAPEYLMAEIRYAVTHEGALHLDDVLARRTRISIEYAHRGVESAPAVAAMMGELLGWSPEVIAHEIAAYEARVEAERASQQVPDDDHADAVRNSAPEIRPHLNPA